MLISVNEQSSQPIYLQIVNQVRQQLREGIIKPGDELPSVRELALILGVNMHTVRSAYLKLRDQEIINLRLGRRATVTRIPRSADSKEVQQELHSRIQELITDGLLANLTAANIRKIMEEELSRIKEE